MCQKDEYSEYELTTWGPQCHHDGDTEAKPHIDGIEPGIGWMGNIEVDQIAAIHKTRRIQGHSCLKRNANQMPLSDFTRTNGVRDEEMLVAVSYTHLTLPTKA